MTRRSAVRRLYQTGFRAGQRLPGNARCGFGLIEDSRNIGDRLGNRLHLFPAKLI